MLHVTTVNQDPGVGPNKEKGASVHVLAMRNAFRQVGATVTEIDASKPGVVRSMLAEHPYQGCDLIYERYALGKAAAARFAVEQQIPYVLEVNAPLAWERRHWRDSAETPAECVEDAYLFSHADAVLAVSSQVADYARERGASPEKIQVAANGVDSRLFRRRPVDDPIRRNLGAADKVILGFHGRLRPWHGFDLLVEVTRRLVDAGLPVFLLAVGNGEFEKILSEALPPKHWHVAGWQPYEDIGRYVAAFDILPLCYPDDMPCYFSPLKLMESMSCGVVPVVPDLGDLATVVQDGANGVVYASGDAAALATAIEQLISDGAKRRKLSAGAERRATEFSWERIANLALGFALPGAHLAAKPENQ